jgi:asparagine synthase (glutamine-hydrolysing)
MCGIAGVACVRPSCRDADHVRIVQTMCDLQHHRGPDDHGVVSLGRVCLGANRLSIIDLSPAGHMPMRDEGDRWWIAYNGEVYNFAELREELTRCGHRFQSRTDTEVVLRAYQHWGERCLDRFVGMFAFAIYDRTTETLILARDRFGKKPLYYSQRDGHVLFSSEMKALLAVCDGLAPNRQRLIEWSLYRNVDFGSPETLVDGVLALLPGYLVKIRHGRLEPPEAYYRPESQVDPALYDRFSRQPVESTTAELESLIVASVRERLVSDVPLGTFCSGGIDSSLITAVAARHLEGVTAFHVSIPGYADLDESRYAKRVTDFLGIRLLTYPIEAEAFRRSLPRAIYFSDFPLTHPNSVAFLLLSEFARQHGVIVLLTGEGADELFGGYVQRYRRYRQLLLLKRVVAHLPMKARKAIAMAGYACDGIPFTELSEYPGLLAHSIEFLDKFSRADLRLRCGQAYGFISNEAERSVLAAMLADLTNFLSPLLRRLDRMSMAASVECRVPFLDHRLVNTVINLPLSYRLRRSTDKWLLKAVASRYLPRTTVYRQKGGFPLPLEDYLAPLAREEIFRGGFCLEFLGMHRRAMLEAVSQWRRNVHGFFNLLALEVWGRLFLLRQPLEEVTAQLVDAASRRTPAPSPAAPAGGRRPRER